MRRAQPLGPIVLLLPLTLPLGCGNDNVVANEGTEGEEIADEPFCPAEPPPLAEPPAEGEPTCEVVPGDHSAAVCVTGVCPITTDVVLSCDREFTQLGVRVAAGEADAHLLSSNEDRAMLLSASGQQGTLESTLPVDSLRQAALLDRGADGRLYVAASHQEGRTVLRHEGDGWKLISSSSPDDDDEQASFRDLESAGDFVHAWYDRDGDWPAHVVYHISSAQALGGRDYPITPGSWTHWTLDHAGSSVSLSMAERAEGWQLGVWRSDPEVPSGYESVIGAPVVACSPLAYRPVPPSKPSAPVAAVPSYSVVIQHPDGLRIAWPDPSASESYVELDVPGTGLAALACASDLEGGRGLAIDGFGVAQTDDGRLWIAWVDAQACEPGQDQILHIASFDFESELPSERLELAIAPLAPPQPDHNARMLHVRAWATQLVIGLRQQGDQGPAVARLIQIDTAGL